MTRRQKREYVLITHGNDMRATLGTSDEWRRRRRVAALTALAAIDAGKRWRDVLKEFER